METAVTTIYLFKALVILVGLALVFMGYRLFIKGITAPAGSFSGEVGDKKVKLVRFAPGIFFALVGTIVVVVGSTRKFSLAMPDGTEAESMENRAQGPGLDASSHMELHSAGNPPEEDGQAVEPHPGGDENGGGVGTHGTAPGFVLCDTCDVQ